MSSPFSISFTRRDFSGPILPSVRLQAERLAWSCFGGPDQADLSASGTMQNLLELTSLLRCGVQVMDRYGEPVWWGYLDRVTVFLEHVQVSVSLEDLFNQVRVQYSYISPDNKLAEQNETDSAINAQSQVEFGVKEVLLNRIDLDEDFAESLRDTFLALHAWPISELSQRSGSGQVSADLHCSGWFKTLGWTIYENNEGFYANYGPGPGIFTFGDVSEHRRIGQSFTPGADCDLKYVYFRLSKEGNPTAGLRARLREDNSGTPVWPPLAMSALVSSAEVSDEKYSWIKFDWGTPYTLNGGQKYWITLDPLGVDASNYYLLKTDENMNYEGHGGKYHDEAAGTWNKLPSVTCPGSRPDVYIRVVCVSDTGEQLERIAAAGNQFFTKVTGLETGIQTSPYRMNGRDCLKEVEALLNLGTANQRLVLVRVTPERQLAFYEQPDPDEADLYLDGQSRFFTKTSAPLPDYLPPVGRWVRLAAVTDIRMPWDRNRLPACFITSAEYFPRDGRVVVKSMK